MGPDSGGIKFLEQIRYQQPGAGATAGTDTGCVKWLFRKIEVSRMNIAKDFHNDFFDSVRTILRDARKKAYASVNFIMVEAYWKIGQRIVEEEQKGKSKAAYGEGLLMVKAY